MLCMGGTVPVRGCSAVLYARWRLCCLDTALGRTHAVTTGGQRLGCGGSWGWGCRTGCSMLQWQAAPVAATNALRRRLPGHPGRGGGRSSAIAAAAMGPTAARACLLRLLACIGVVIPHRLLAGHCSVPQPHRRGHVGMCLYTQASPICCGRPLRAHANPWGCVRAGMHAANPCKEGRHCGVCVQVCAAEPGCMRGRAAAAPTAVRQPARALGDPARAHWRRRAGGGVPQCAR